VRVLLTGATGLIGAAVLAELHAAGHEVRAVTRRQGPGTRRLAPAEWIELDIARATAPQAWSAALDGVDAVVNCAGVLQDSSRDSTAGVHRDGPAALFTACEAAGVRRVIQVSAMGADAGTTAFSRTKAEADTDLAMRDLDWVILRPSVVVGRQAYGGSALFRGLAMLPALPEVSKAGDLQIVQLDEVAETVRFFLNAEAPARVILELAGPERLTFTEVVAHYRRWLGYPPARRLPGAYFMPLAFRLGDLASLFGWRPPVRSTAHRELLRGAVGDPGPWMTATGIRPRSLGEALASEPASVQERWFAGLYLLKPVILAVFAAFWLLTGALTFGPAWPAAVEQMRAAGGGPFASFVVAGGALADLAIGLGILFRRTARPALWAGFVLSLGYLAAGTLLAPELWIGPLGPLTKVVPILALNLVALAILEDR
jgi:uncharacterized protein YbjT (DUF2867 family)